VDAWRPVGVGVGPTLSSAAEQATTTESMAPRARAANLRGHVVIIYSRWG
jgi:hypothetical protein